MESLAGNVDLSLSTKVNAVTSGVKLFADERVARGERVSAK